MKGAATAPGGYDEAPVRYVGGKAFYRRGDVWRDVAADDAAWGPATELKFAGDDYFTFLKDHPEAAAYFALGSRVEFVYDGKLYRVTP